MEIIYKPISELKPFQKNPKKHPEKQIKMLKKSMAEFGWTNPILVSQDNMVIAGHARLQAARESGFTEVPTIFIDLPYERAVAYVLADNRLAEIAENDDKLIAELLEEVTEIPDFDIESIGYSTEDVDQLLHDIEVHDAMYKPGEGAIKGGIDFIKDETDAMEPDDEAAGIFEGKGTILVTYSGGKDSTFALLWAKKNYPEKRIIAVFSDTGVEFPGMTAHIWNVCNHLGVECKIVKPALDPWVNFAEKGKFFNIIFPECQERLVFQPINDYYLEFDSKDVVIIDGSRGDQARRTTKKTKTSGANNPKLKDYSFYHPVYDIDYETEEAVINKSGVPMWEGYGMGFKRSACWCCPAQSGEQAYALSLNYPGLVEVIRRWEKKLGMPLQYTNNKGIDDLIESGRKKAQKREGA